MEVFYGQVQGSGSTRATRQGSEESGIASSVQSYDGSITTELFIGKDDKLWIQVYASSWSEFYGNTLFRGTLDDYCEKLCGKKFEEAVR